jgi:hypothetical protein
MKQRSPTLEGFRVMFTRPSLGLAEIAWRWTFGFAAISLLTFSVLQYLDTLPVGPGDLFLLQTGHPLLVSHAIAHILQGSAFRAAKAALLLLLLLSLAWVVIASWSRMMTVTALVDYFREDKIENRGELAQVRDPKVRPRSPLGLNLLRVAIAAAATLGVFGAFLLARAASPATNPSPGSAALIFLTLVMGIFLAWSFLNWILSLAAIFAVAEGSLTFSAISKAVDLWRVRSVSVLAASTWFGLAHFLVFVIASSIIAVPLGFAGMLPPAIVLGGVLLVILLYFAAADFLYAGRMAAYVAMIQLPLEPITPPDPPPLLLNPDHSTTPAPIARMDRDELILSDIPMLHEGSS